MSIKCRASVSQVWTSAPVIKRLVSINLSPPQYIIKLSPRSDVFLNIKFPNTEFPIYIALSRHKIFMALIFLALWILSDFQIIIIDRIGCVYLCHFLFKKPENLTKIDISQLYSEASKAFRILNELLAN